MSLLNHEGTKTRSKYKPYPEYKDSGVKWLGEVPEHWKTSYLRYLFSFGKGLTITKADLIDEGVPCLNYGEVHSKFGFEVNPEIHELKCVSECYINSSSFALLKNGDIVFADTSEDLEGSGNFTQLISESLTFAGYHTIIARSITDANHRFLAYLLDSQEFRTQIQLAVKGVKVFSITQAILRSAFAWLPTNSEQTQIANFLDQETSKMDLLIEKQQKLITLLKEKRQAVISHAVTKGLNPNAPLKDSGIEWLGQIPEHWIVKKGRYVYDYMQTGTTPPTSNREYFNGEVNWFNPKDLNNETLYESEKKLTNLSITDGQTKIFPSDSVLVVGIGATAGKTSYLTTNASFNQQITGFKSNKQNNEFLFYALKTQTSVMLKIAKFTTLPILNNEFFGGFELAVPPIDEQIEIVNYLNIQTQKIDTLIEKSQQAIELLKERKTALISAAVTGKIDVRDSQA